MADAPAAPWKLSCPWCEWEIWVSARGQRGDDPGSGVEAAKIGADHAASHGRSWRDFVEAMR